MAVASAERTVQWSRKISQYYMDLYAFSLVPSWYQKYMYMYVLRWIVTDTIWFRLFQTPTTSTWIHWYTGCGLLSEIDHVRGGGGAGLSSLFNFQSSDNMWSSMGWFRITRYIPCNPARSFPTLKCSPYNADGTDLKKYVILCIHDISQNTANK